MLTDLQAILGNLAFNARANYEALHLAGGAASCGELDWANAELLQTREDTATTCTSWQDPKPGDVQVVIASDPVYMPEHPHLLVQAVKTWLSRSADARLVIAYPLRPEYATQIAELRNRLKENELEVLEESRITGRDDWQHEVEHSWSVWSWT